MLFYFLQIMASGKVLEQTFVNNPSIPTNLEAKISETPTLQEALVLPKNPQNFNHEENYHIVLRAFLGCYLSCTGNRTQEKIKNSPLPHFLEQLLQNEERAAEFASFCAKKHGLSLLAKSLLYAQTTYAKATYQGTAKWIYKLPEQPGFFTEFLSYIVKDTNNPCSDKNFLAFANEYTRKIKEQNKHSKTPEAKELTLLSDKYSVILAAIASCTQNLTIVSISKSNFFKAIETLIIDPDEALALGQFCAASSIVKDDAKHIEIEGAKLLPSVITLTLHSETAKNLSQKMRLFMIAFLHQMNVKTIEKDEFNMISFNVYNLAHDLAIHKDQLSWMINEMRNAICQTFSQEKKHFLSNEASSNMAKFAVELTLNLKELETLPLNRTEGVPRIDNFKNRLFLSVYIADLLNIKNQNPHILKAIDLYRRRWVKENCHTNPLINITLDNLTHEECEQVQITPDYLKILLGLIETYQKGEKRIVYVVKELPQKTENEVTTDV